MIPQIIILIVGGKYGTIDQVEQISYTEKEFNYARKNHIPVVAFMVKNIDALIASKTEKEPTRLEKLNSFRKRLLNKEGITIQFFDNIQNLKYEVSQSISQVIKDCPRPGWVRQSQELLNKDCEIIENIPDVDIKFEKESVDISNLSKMCRSKSNIPSISDLSERARKILLEVYDDSNNQILVCKTLDGINIQSNNKCLMTKNSKREEIEVLDAISELVNLELLTDLDKRGEVFQITKKGFDVVDGTKEQRVLNYDELPDIKLSDIETLTTIIGDTQNGISHKQIKKYFEICEIEDVSPSAGKPDRLFDAFSAQQKSQNSSEFLWRFIDKTLDPIRKNYNISQYEYLLEGVNQVLKKYNVVFIEGRFYSVKN